MNTRILSAVGIVLLCCAVLVGATIERQDPGGLWSTVNSWDPNQLPGSGDLALHGTQASGAMTYDDMVPPANQTIADFRFIEGSGRGLVIDDMLSLTVTGDFARMSGSGGYTTELGEGSTLTVVGAITRGTYILGLDAEVTASSIALAANSDWTLNGGVVDVSGGITRSSGAPVPTFTINDDGILEVGGSANFFNLNINAGGSADINNVLEAGGDAIVDGGALTAGSHDSTSGEDFIIRNGGSVSVTGEFEIGLSSSLQYGNMSGGSVDNTLSCDGLNFSASTAQFKPDTGTASPSLGVTMSGDFDVATTGSPFSGFNPSGVVLTFEGSGTQTLEAFSTDYDVNSVGNVWYGVNLGCGDQVYNARPLAGLIVGTNASVEVTDLVTNAYRAGGYTQDALYVDGDVTVESGGELDLGSTVLYHTGSVSGNVVGTTAVGVKRCYGDFDFDGDVDTADFALFGQKFTGAEGQTSDALFDADADEDVDTADFALFAQNFSGAENPCPASCSESSGGGNPAGCGACSAEDIANWCLSHLSEAACERFAETLVAVAEGLGETDEAAFYLDIAELLTAE